MKVQMTWEDDNRLVVACAGELGWDGQEDLVRKLAETLADHEAARVIVDLEAVDLITSAGLGSLLQVRKLVNERHGQLVLANATPGVAQVFRTVGLNRHVLMADTVEDGRAMLAGDGQHVQ